MTGQVKLEAVSRMPREHELEEERGMPDQNVCFFCFPSLSHEWLSR